MAGIDKTSYIFKWLSETEVPSGLHTKRTSDDFNGTRAPIRECNAPEEVQNQNKTSHKLIQQQRSENTHANPLQPPCNRAPLVDVMQNQADQIRQ